MKFTRRCCFCSTYELDMEGVVLEGWLVKSPPEKRIIKAKWRQRWFVLRHSGALPGQFVLEYFNDKSCKKLRGRIDLDQCDQIDSGVQYDSKKTTSEYIFDIKTPKRIYYLVAETEAEMNKWVECICSVCGLKIHVDDDYLVNQRPNPSNVVQSAPSSQGTAHIKSYSNAYIPISECHTGKPISNGSLPPANTPLPSTAPVAESYPDMPKDPPPPPPPLSDDITADDFYDHPKPLRDSSDGMRLGSISADDFYKVPVQPKSGGDNFSTLPPRVNWNTYPDEAFLPGSSTVPRRKAEVEELNVYDVVPTFHGSIKDMPLQKKKVENLTSHFESMSAKEAPEPVQSCTSESALAEQSETYQNVMGIIPPRPPKPSKMKERHAYENYEPGNKEADHPTYDTPAPAAKSANQSSLAVSPAKSEPSDVESPTDNTVVPAPAPKGQPTMDDVYDFPKSRLEDNLNIPVPPPPQNTGTAGRNRRHAYTNAPPGLFNNKDLIFNYEYRPSLHSEAYSSPDGQPGSEATTPPSPSAIGAYANVPTSPTLVASLKSDLPPAVNRNLKPKRLGSDDKDLNFLTLQPPPVCRSRLKTSQRSFKKPRAAPSPTPSNGMPPIPNRFRHPQDIATASDDETSHFTESRRNSSNDDQVHHFLPGTLKKDEIQYLDLDLDSEPSPSPKTPERLAESTVYKKVDFLKTKALSDIKQNMDNQYRKSQ